MYDIAYDITENNSTLQMKLPTDLYDDFTLSFDLEKESLSETSTVKVLEDSTIVTNTTEYLYQEVDGTLLKIGNIQNIEYDIQRTIDASDYVLPIINSRDDVREITREEREQKSKEGTTYHEVSPIIGDPSNLDYVETVLTLYDDIEINSVDDSYFRVMW